MEFTTWNTSSTWNTSDAICMEYLEMFRNNCVVGFPLNTNYRCWSLYQNISQDCFTIYPDGAVWNATLIQWVVILSIIIILTFVGNTTIIVVLCRTRSFKQTSRVNMFILHLAIGDLSVCLLTQASEILFEIFGEWILGNVGCKVVVYFQIVSLASTTFILTSMSYDRYSAICRPLKSHKRGVKTAEYLILFSWTLAFIVAVPQLFIWLQVEDGMIITGRPRYVCKSAGYEHFWQRQLYIAWMTVYILIIPASLMIFFYVNVFRAVSRASCEATLSANGDSSRFHLRRSVNAAGRLPRARIKTLKLTVCIISGFLICWTPYLVVMNIRIHSHYRIKIEDVFDFTRVMAVFNSVLNPIFYGLFNAQIRKGLLELFYKNNRFKKCMQRRSKQYDLAESQDRTCDYSRSSCYRGRHDCNGDAPKSMIESV